VTSLKNAIDWASRPYGKDAFTRKPSAVIGTSPGKIGTAIAQQHLRSMVFSDVDVMAVGPVVADVSSDFDQYWSSDSSYPAAQLLPPEAPQDASRLQAAASRMQRERGAAGYMTAMRELHCVRDVMEGRLAFTWAPTHMISDDPAKGLGLAARESLLPAQLAAIIGESAVRVDLVSAYFVPGEEGTETLVSLARRGVAVRVLTNSLAATDVGAVHAGYARRRQALLEGGVALFELRGSPIPREASPGRQPIVEPARQELRGRRCARLRGLVQLRSQIRRAQHGDGFRNRKRDARADARDCTRREHRGGALL
jgi:phosphatidylserine/phosphatidylglycerophosphate/cardiolipin synthase-like enzyme